MSPALAKGHLCTCFLSVDSAKCPGLPVAGNEKSAGLLDMIHRRQPAATPGKGVAVRGNRGPGHQLC